jgi:hypothetical protein
MPALSRYVIFSVILRAGLPLRVLADLPEVHPDARLVAYDLRVVARGDRGGLARPDLGLVTRRP